MTKTEAKSVFTDIANLTDVIGTEVRGVQLTSLSDEAIVLLQQLVAERGVLYFPEQRMSVAQQHEFGSRLGDLLTDPFGTPADGFPEVLILHADENTKKAVGDGWHSDMPVEQNPPALSMLRLETTPPVGGDTVYASMYGAFESLSIPMQAFLSSLTGINSGERYRVFFDLDEIPVAEHPIVRTHPLTARQALYADPLFTTRIAELSPRESDSLLHFLADHVSNSVDCQVRLRWEPGAVAIWDNRCVQHHAVFDYHPHVRHGYRITTRGEMPFHDDRK